MIINIDTIITQSLLTLAYLDVNPIPNLDVVVLVGELGDHGDGMELLDALLSVGSLTESWQK